MPAVGREQNEAATYVEVTMREATIAYLASMLVGTMTTAAVAWLQGMDDAGRDRVGAWVERLLWLMGLLPKDQYSA
jgi:hypothetical protein